MLYVGSENHALAFEVLFVQGDEFGLQGANLGVGVDLPSLVLNACLLCLVNGCLKFIGCDLGFQHLQT